ncbi:MICOS complex subunit mic25-b [Anoplophora glabripennis]|uniref:Coiled-coil-helix-coiled-coil-helix domain-containing protein 6, mitochondrial n=1 Tax=Anoplophora glabripennis TaxID=217634 RepID=V5GRH9_ANOGL|nr:MICOS complex subunit mic25-b [Anoplophora glabripennis]
MGGATSKTRKLTVENEDPTSVIKVSEGVVDRIRGSQMVRQEVQQNPSVVAPPAGGPFVTAPLLFLNEPSLTSLQLRQAHVAELKNNDEYWQNRIKTLESNHKKINEIMDKEFSEAVDEIQQTSHKIAKNCEPPCQDMKKAVMECYKYYPNEPMRCAKVVQAFQECVDLKRSSVIANRG